MGLADLLRSVFSLSSVVKLNNLVAFSLSGRVFSFLEELDAHVESGDDLGLRDTETGGGGNIHSAVSTDGGVLTTETSHGETEGLGNGLALGVSAVLGEVGEGDVEGSSHAGTDVGGAGGDDTVVGGDSAATVDVVLNDLDGLFESVEDFVNDGALLHAHDTEMVLLTVPDDEALVLRDVAATTMGPVTGNTSGDEVRVDGHILEHDVFFNVLVVLLLCDKVLVAGGDGNVSSTVVLISDEDIVNLTHIKFHVDAVFLGHSTGEGVLAQVTAGTDSHGELGETKLGHVEDTGLGETGNTSKGPVVDVLLDGEVNLVVLSEGLLEEAGELVVIVGVHGVAAHAGVGVGDTGEAAGKEAELLLGGEGVVVSLIESLGHAVLGLGSLDLKDLGNDTGCGVSVNDKFTVLGLESTFGG